MSYEVIETRIEEINDEITVLNNKIVELTWIDKDFSKLNIKKVQNQIDRLMDEKYELKAMIV